MQLAVENKLVQEEIKTQIIIKIQYQCVWNQLFVDVIKKEFRPCVVTEELKKKIIKIIKTIIIIIYDKKNEIIIMKIISSNHSNCDSSQ